jgi:hypothetical protein
MLPAKCGCFSGAAGFAIAVLSGCGERTATAPEDRPTSLALESGPWSMQGKLVAAERRPESRFGAAMAIAGDTAVVGTGMFAPRGEAAYVFTGSGGTWTQQQVLVNSDDSESHFGGAVATSGDTIVVGAIGDGTYGAAFVFARSGPVWTRHQKLVPSLPHVRYDFGGSVAIDGDTIVVGSHINGDAEAVHVFVSNGSAWTEQKLKASDARPPRSTTTTSAATSRFRAIRLPSWRTGRTLSTSTRVRVPSGPSDRKSPSILQ